MITRQDQVTPEWLTSVLGRSGVLEAGAVDGFEIVRTLERELSSSARLKLSYAAGSRGELPDALFLKTVNTHFDEDDPLLPSEVNYYVRDYVGVEGVPLLRCYDAALSEDSVRFHLLLEDVSATHVWIGDKTVNLEFGFVLAEGLAAMHTHWWGAARLHQGGEPVHGAEHIERFVEIARPGVDHILECCANELKSHWPQAMFDVYENHPRLMIERTSDANGFTLIHGDVSPGNILVPINGDRPLYLIDRGPFEWSLTTWLGVYDLSYAMVTFWEVDTRRELEEPILRRYHTELVERGVTGYSWEQLYEDYRLCIAVSVYVATEWCRGAANLQWKDMWMPMLQRALTAFDDLECSNLWTSN